MAKGWQRLIPVRKNVLITSTAPSANTASPTNIVAAGGVVEDTARPPLVSGAKSPVEAIPGTPVVGSPVPTLVIMTPAGGLVPIQTLNAFSTANSSNASVAPVASAPLVTKAAAPKGTILVPNPRRSAPKPVTGNSARTKDFKRSSKKPQETAPIADTTTPDSKKRGYNKRAIQKATSHKRSQKQQIARGIARVAEESAAITAQKKALDRIASKGKDKAPLRESPSPESETGDPEPDTEAPLFILPPEPEVPKALNITEVEYVEAAVGPKPDTDPAAIWNQVRELMRMYRQLYRASLKAPFDDPNAVKAPEIQACINACPKISVAFNKAMRAYGAQSALVIRENLQQGNITGALGGAWFFTRLRRFLLGYRLGGAPARR